MRLFVNFILYIVTLFLIYVMFFVYILILLVWGLMNWVLFLRNVSGLLTEGVGMPTILSQLESQAILNKEKRFISVIRERILTGEPFLKVWVDVSNFSEFSNLGSLVIVPDLPAVLDSLADYLDSLTVRKHKMVSFVRYPCFLFISLLFCGGVIFKIVLPTYIPVLESLYEVLPTFVVWFLRHKDTVLIGIYLVLVVF